MRIGVKRINSGRMNSFLTLLQPTHSSLPTPIYSLLLNHRFYPLLYRTLEIITFTNFLQTEIQMHNLMTDFDRKRAEKPTKLASFASFEFHFTLTIFIPNNIRISVLLLSPFKVSNSRYENGAVIIISPYLQRVESIPPVTSASFSHHWPTQAALNNL